MKVLIKKENPLQIFDKWKIRTIPINITTHLILDGSFGNSLVGNKNLLRCGITTGNNSIALY